MKKILGAVAASLLLAGTASAADSATQTINGTVGAAVDISVAESTSLSQLNAGGFASGSTIVTVNSTSAYNVQVASNFATMTQHDGLNYVTAVKLDDPMTVTAVAAGVDSGTDAAGQAKTVVVGTTAKDLFIGEGAVNAGSIQVDYTQPVAWGTPAGDYRIELTYTVSLPNVG